MSGIQGLGNVGGMNLSGMDIETALLAVQSQRTQLLDSQLADQIKGVQGRNDAISKLNAAMGSVSSLQGKVSGTDAGSKVPDNAENKKLIQDTKNALTAAGMDPSKFDLTTKGGLDAAATSIKGTIDTQTNSQQMDMLRLQSLSNKRNESFDVMTNFVKKMQDSRSSIIGNMR